MLQALWHDRFEAPRRYPVLERDIEADVAIVGAGITGLTLAWQLRGSGLRVAVLEAREVGSGTTGASTGNLYVPVGPGLAGIERKHGAAALRVSVAARIAALGFIERVITDNAVACGFERVPFQRFALGAGDQEALVRAECAAAQRVGLQVDTTVPDDFPFRVDALCSLPGQAQFDPLRYVAALAALLADGGCAIYEHSPVLEAHDGDPCRLRTANGTVRARHLVKATHIPQGRYLVHALMAPRREYALLVRLAHPAPPAGIYWAETRDGRYSLRPWRDAGQHHLLVLGQPHEPGMERQAHLSAMESFVRTHFEVTGIDYLWCAQNYQPADHLPYIGRAPGESHTWIATGFAADGLVWGTVAGALIAAAIQGRDEANAALFSPRRCTPLASLRLATRQARAVGGHLVKDRLLFTPQGTVDEVLPGEGRVVELDGEQVGAYRDELGQLTVVSATCPHMGCRVHWNGLEKSWDCPCHGSRFATNGSLLEGPAATGLEVKRLP